MELIGKKVTRKTAFQESNEPKLTVFCTDKVGRLGVTEVVMRKINLFDKEIGIAYDGDKAFMYITEEAGNKVKDNGSISTKYHAKRLMSTFGITAEKYVFDINTEAKNFAEQGDVDFYEISVNNALVMEVEEAGIDSDLASEVIDTDSLEETLNVVDDNNNIGEAKLAEAQEGFDIATEEEY